MSLNRYEEVVGSPDFASWGEVWTLEAYSSNDHVVVSVVAA